jgi:hypothetical protein
VATAVVVVAAEVVVVEAAVVSVVSSPHAATTRANVAMSATMPRRLFNMGVGSYA